VSDIRDKFTEGIIVSTSRGLSDAWTNRRYQSKHLWAYRPLNVEAVPASAHPVDWFIDRKLDENDLALAPAAGQKPVTRSVPQTKLVIPPSSVFTISVTFMSRCCTCWGSTTTT
jgi:hypothetical protein